MMKKSQKPLNFYSNVHLSGEKIHYIGYEDGQRVQYRDTFSPVLYARCNEVTEFKTLEGQYVEDFKPGSIKESREFLEEYKEVENFKVYGQTQFLYQWISNNNILI
mgnify:CR=1 FL=1